jgi:SM-20-related protein
VTEHHGAIGQPVISLPVINQSVIEQLVEGLGVDGYAVATLAFDPRLCAALHDEAGALPVDPARIDAGVGRATGHTREHDIRQSTIKWIDGVTRGQRLFLEAVEPIRLEINRRLFLGLFDFEAQLAIYAPGGFYARHVDSFTGERNRVVSLVAYLTPDWPIDGGGELDIWSNRSVEATPGVTVTPEAGTLVLMLSEDIPHQVRIARHPRTSIAGWWRVRVG